MVGGVLSVTKRSRACKYVAAACISASSRRTDRPRAAEHSVLAARSALLCCAGRTGEDVVSMQALPGSLLSLRRRSLRTPPKRPPPNDHFRRNSRIVLGGTRGGDSSSASKIHTGEFRLLSTGVAGSCPGTDREPDELTGSGGACTESKNCIESTICVAHSDEARRRESNACNSNYSHLSAFRAGKLACNEQLHCDFHTTSADLHTPRHAFFFRRGSARPRFFPMFTTTCPHVVTTSARRRHDSCQQLTACESGAT